MSQLLTRILRQRNAAPLGRSLMAVVAPSSTLASGASDGLMLSTSQSCNLQPLRTFHSTPLNFKASASPEMEDEEVKASDDEQHLSLDNPHWVNAGLHPEILNVLKKKGIETFTPVQGEAFEPVLAGRDVIGRSRTGTGKTLAFGLPTMTRLVASSIDKGTRDEASGRMRRGRKPSMLVLCPTRELARQVQDELDKPAKILGLDTAVFHGGVSYTPQLDALRNGLDVLVATPGRVMDHLKRGSLDLGECGVVVLDEGDEMLNMGFADDVEFICNDVGSANEEKTQFLIFSATTPDWVKNIGKRYTENPLMIDATGDEGGARVASTVRHLAIQVPPTMASKKGILEDLIAVEISKAAAEKNQSETWSQKLFGKVIIFTETKKEADELVTGGVFNTLTAQSLHGDHSQRQRDTTLDGFRSGAFNVLVATDVAARGIDIRDVDLVIQLDPPRDVDTYVHRSGRTGRAGKKGVSILLFNPDQARNVVWIERDLGHNFQFDIVAPPSVEAAMEAAAKTSSVALSSIPDSTISIFKDTAKEMLTETTDPEDLVARCLAAMSRRSTKVQTRSMLTGQAGMTTLQMTSDGSVPAPRLGDIWRLIKTLASMSQGSENEFAAARIGEAQEYPTKSAILFDLPSEDARNLIEVSRKVELDDLNGLEFSVVKELEIERGRDFGRPPDRFGGRGGRGNGNRNFNQRGGQGRGYNNRDFNQRGGRNQGWNNRNDNYSGGRQGGGYGGNRNNFNDRQGGGRRQSAFDQGSNDFNGGGFDDYRPKGWKAPFDRNNRYDGGSRGGNSGRGGGSDDDIFNF